MKGALRCFPLLTALIVLLVAAAGARAGLALPHYVHTADDFEEAAETALGRGEPLAFVYTDRDSGCNLASAATLDAFRVLKDDSVIVYACSLRDSGDWTRLPEVVRTALRSPGSGRYIPKTVIVDPGATRVLSVIPYVADPKARIEALEQALAKALGEIEETEAAEAD